MKSTFEVSDEIENCAIRISISEKYVAFLYIDGKTHSISGIVTVPIDKAEKMIREALRSIENIDQKNGEEERV